MLPWVNGFEVLATIREDPALNTLPVLVVTAVAASESDLQAFGPLMVVRKPFDTEALVPLVYQLLGRHSPVNRTDLLGILKGRRRGRSRAAAGAAARAWVVFRLT